MSTSKKPITDTIKGVSKETKQLEIITFDYQGLRRLPTSENIFMREDKQIHFISAPIIRSEMPIIGGTPTRPYLYFGCRTVQLETLTNIILLLEGKATTKKIKCIYKKAVGKKKAVALRAEYKETSGDYIITKSNKAYPKSTHEVKTKTVKIVPDSTFKIVSDNQFIYDGYYSINESKESLLEKLRFCKYLLETLQSK